MTITSGGRILDTDVEEVRRRSDLVQIASEYMQVRKAGRLYKALCPFHQEKTPSFSIDPAKGLYFCHGCQQGGDVISLVSKLESLSFVETIERLARRAGLELHYEQRSPAERQAHKRRLRLVDAHRAAMELYHRELLSSDEAAEARDYLKGRTIHKEQAERFSIGYSPNKWDWLVSRLRKRGFVDQEMVDAGLASKTQDGRVVDRFRGRVMFPIFEVTGDPVAFGARRLREDDEGPKYLNSAESPIYKKGQVLYALNWAKGEIVKTGRALVCEGYTDVIALQMAGLGDAVATCGTALGLEHLRTLQRFTKDVRLSLDSDEAGLKAAERTYDQLIGDAQAMDLTLRVVQMPQGYDPADAVAKLGAEAVRELVDRAVPLLEIALRREVQRYTLGDPEVKERALAACLRILAKTDNRNTQDEYIRRLSDWVKIRDPNVLYVELAKVMETGVVPKATTQTVLRRSSAQVRLEREALKLALQFPAYAKAHVADTGPEFFSVPSHRAVWTEFAEGKDVGGAGSKIDEDARAVVTELSVQPVDGEVNDELVADIFLRLKEFVLTRQIEQVKTRLQALNPTTHEAEHWALYQELIELERAKRALNESESGEGDS